MYNTNWNEGNEELIFELRDYIVKLVNEINCIFLDVRFYGDDLELYYDNGIESFIFQIDMKSIQTRENLKETKIEVLKWLFLIR